MTINTIAGVGMLAAGLLGNPVIGSIQDRFIDDGMQANAPELVDQVLEAEGSGLLGARTLNDDAVAMLPEEDQERVVAVQSASSQLALKTVAWLPAFMFVCYVLLILYFRSKGGYKPVELKLEEETGGVEDLLNFSAGLLRECVYISIRCNVRTERRRGSPGALHRVSARNPCNKSFLIIPLTL